MRYILLAILMFIAASAVAGPEMLLAIRSVPFPTASHFETNLDSWSNAGYVNTAGGLSGGYTGNCLRSSTTGFSSVFQLNITRNVVMPKAGTITFYLKTGIARANLITVAVNSTYTNLPGYLTYQFVTVSVPAGASSIRISSNIDGGEGAVQIWVDEVTFQ